MGWKTPYIELTRQLIHMGKGARARVVSTDLLTLCCKCPIKLDNKVSIMEDRV